MNDLKTWAIRQRTRIFLNKQRIVRLSKESAWILLGQIMGLMGALALVRVMTEYLVPAQYGQLALALTVGVLVCQISLSGVMPGIMRFYTLAVERGDVSNYTTASRILMGYGTVGTIVLGAIIILGVLLTGYNNWFLCLLLAIAFT